jgi:multicomponent Na+:H+ antiporter subunit E
VSTDAARARPARAAAHAAGLAITLAALWMLLSGHTEPLLLGLGAGSVSGVTFLAHRMDVVDREGFPIHLGVRAPLYWGWLAVEIVKSSLEVAWRILRGCEAISPVTLRVPSTQRADLGRVIYANSITLTPGTVTLHAEPGALEVHALTRTAGAALLEGTMDRRVTAVEGV